MTHFCNNRSCANPGFKMVPVSVQHGATSAQAKSAQPNLSRFLKKDGFVILTRNDDDPSRQGPFEAWAYRGPLDLRAATPVTFGVGMSVPDALDALELQLQNTHPRVGS